MRVRWRSRVVVLLLAALLTACGGPSATPHFASATGGLPAGSFLAVYAHGSGDTGGGHGSSLSLFSLATGVRLRDLLQLPERSGVALSGQARDAAGDVYLGLSSDRSDSDPAGGSNRASGGCADALWRIDASSGRHSRLFPVDRGRRLRAPVPSRDGRAVAYLSSSCPRSDEAGGGGRNSTAPSDTVMVIRDLATCREQQLRGAGVPSWSVDGTRLVAPHDGGGFLVTNVAAGAGRSPVVLPVPGGGCLNAAAFDRAGIVLAVGCTTNLGDTARLVQLDDTGNTVLWSAPTQLCPNGMTLVADATGDRLLMTAAATDATTGVCSGLAAPVDVVQSWTGQQAHDIARYTNPQQFVSTATW